MEILVYVYRWNKYVLDAIEEKLFEFMPIKAAVAEPEVINRLYRPVEVTRVESKKKTMKIALICLILCTVAFTVSKSCGKKKLL